MASDAAHIQRSLIRLESATARSSTFGHSTDAAVTELVDGLRCRTAIGDHVVESDLPRGLGGEATAPTPGALLRAALGSCLAMGYRLRAARRGVALDAIRVVVETDSEIDGMLRLGTTARPGFSEVRYHVELTSDASDEELQAIADEADRLSPMLDAIGRTNRVERTLSIDRTRADR